jgi:predicted nicotinamide N-methyase
VPEELVSQTIELPSGELRLLQPEEAAALPDAGAVEWAPIAPYWSVLWRSGVALACELDGVALRGLRVVELGCGLGVPSIAAARAGAVVLATDAYAEALTLVARNAHANDVRIETATVDWAGRSWRRLSISSLPVRLRTRFQNPACAPGERRIKRGKDAGREQ